MEESGVKELNIKDDQVHLRGTEEQCSVAKKIIDRILKVQLDLTNSKSATSNSVPVIRTQIIFPSDLSFSH